MSLSRLSLPAVVLFSSLVFAQHHDTSSPAPASAPAASPAPATHSASAATPSSMGPSHTVEMIHPSVSNASSVHSAPTMPSAMSTTHEPGIGSAKINANDSAVRTKAGEIPLPTAGNRVLGESPSNAPAKPVGDDLRKSLCDGGPCKEAAVQPAPPAKDDLRRCKVGECKCGPGETSTKNGCVANPISPVTKNQCSAGTTWNGSSCVTNTDCPAGQSWNGVSCGPTVCSAGKVLRGSRCEIDCSMATAGTATYIALVRNARMERDDACRANSSSTECQQADLAYQSAVAQYRSAMASIPNECQSALPLPETL